MSSMTARDEANRYGESNDLEIARMLVLSTEHLSSGEMAGLTANAVDGLIVYPYDYGVFLYVPEDLPDAWRLPSQDDGGPSSELIGILTFAHERGIGWIKFDRDANPVRDLPVFDGWL